MFDFDVSTDPNAVAMGAQFFAFGSTFDDFRFALQQAVRNVAAPSFRKNFDVGGRPRWQELDYKTIWQKEDKGSSSPEAPLRLTGDLMDAAGDPGNWNITKDTAEFSLPGSVFYGNIHQFGAEHIPARPFAMLQPEDVDQIEQIIDEWIGLEFDATVTLGITPASLL